MKTELAPLAQQPTPRSALSAMALRFNVEPAKLLDTLKNTAFKGATDSQMMALCVVANEYGLNPFTKEIYAFPDSKSGGIVPVIGVDGWFRIVNDHPQFDGVEFEDAEDADGNLIATECRIFRKDRSRATIISEHLSECRRNTDPWKNSPRRMLRHRAFIQCARLAFGMAGADPEDAERMIERPAKGRVVVAPETMFKAPALPDNSPIAAEQSAGISSGVAIVPTHHQEAAGLDSQEASGDSEIFSLEAEDTFPADAAPDVQLDWLCSRGGMSEAELFGILHRAKLVGPEIKSAAAMSDKQIAKVVKSWDGILAEREGGAA